MGLVVGIAAWLFMAVAVGAAAGRRGRSGTAFFLLALLISPVMAGLWLGAAGPGGVACPRCRELIKSGASVCRFCGVAFAPAPRMAFGAAAPLLIGIVLATIALVVLHAAAFGMDVRFLLPLPAIALASAVGWHIAPSLRSKSSRELVTWVRERPLVWQISAGVVAICEVLTLGNASVRHFRHRSVNAALALPDDCASSSAWTSLATEARETATSDDVAVATRRQTACTDRQQKESAARYFQQCGDASKHLLAGQITPEDRSVLTRAAPVSGDYLSDPTGAFSERIASRTLLPADVEQRWYPCGPTTRPAFLKAVAESTSLWSALSDATKVPEEVLQDLGAKPSSTVTTPMTEAAKAALHVRAEQLAALVASPKVSAEWASALAMCRLDDRLGNAGGPSCTKLAKTEAALTAAEAAKKKADEAREQARQAAADRCRKNCDALIPSSADDPDDRWDKCMERCSGLDKLDSRLPF